MSKEIEKLIKVQGIINRDKYHLAIITDLDDYLEIKLKRYNGIENTIENHIPRID